jgi:transposase-like protein
MDLGPEGVEAMARQCAVDVKDRREAVLSLLRREESAAVIARRIGVSEPTLYRWRDEFMAGGETALASGSGKWGVDARERRIAELEAQIEKREQVIGEYTIANRI